MGWKLYIATVFSIAVLVVTGSSMASPKLLSATHLGGEGADNVEGVAIAADGAIYIVGNTDAPLTPEALKVKVQRLGEVVPPRRILYRTNSSRSREGEAMAQYGCAFVAKLSADGTKLLNITQLAKGIAKFTTVEVNNHGVYVGGYATEGAEPLLADLGGLIRKSWDEQTQIRAHVYRDHYTDDWYDRTKDVRGCPIVLRFTPDLGRIDAGTYLEGWQSIWHCPRPLREDRWQPTGVGLLSDGDVAVCHDGGYQSPVQPGGEAGIRHFFEPGDYLSRLSPDLKSRRWQTTVHTPPVDPKKVNRYYRDFDWDRDYLGQTRTLRMRVIDGNRIVMGGWSPGQTSREPWWSPFLFCYGEDGKLQWRAYNPSPMSGQDDRMGHLVSDSAIRSVNGDGRGNVLLAGIGDGGNSVLRRDPRDYTKEAPALRGSVHSFRGRVLFWGMVGRLDAKTQALLGGDHLGGYVSGRRGQSYAPAWATDLAPLPDGAVAVVGRHTGGFRFTDGAWARSDEGSFVRIYDERFGLRFSTSLPDADIMTLAVRGRRAVAVGVARSDATPMQTSAVGQRGGGEDGFVAVMDLGSEE